MPMRLSWAVFMSWDRGRGGIRDLPVKSNNIQTVPYQRQGSIVAAYCCLRLGVIPSPIRQLNAPNWCREVRMGN
ncbi:hypothetical protein F5Y17DRAFT_416238 [Xylariaceae sp. FL0594]|nr:hypothetical protein F5Y17DRAFT_416238 [Xylariaceae sp. FL0594]